MHARPLRALGRDRPKPRFDVDFGPGRADHFARSSGCQDRKLKCSGCGRVALAELSDERRNVGVGQRGVMATGEGAALR
jgi:hypothetical protein